MFHCVSRCGCCRTFQEISFSVNTKKGNLSRECDPCPKAGPHHSTGPIYFFVLNCGIISNDLVEANQIYLVRGESYRCAKQAGDSSEWQYMGKRYNC